MYTDIYYNLPDIKNLAIKIKTFLLYLSLSLKSKEYNS